MVDVTDRPVMTVHAYSPPLTSMGLYRVGDDGYVRRCSVDWEERLQS
jgi:hypothetical protein